MYSWRKSWRWKLDSWPHNPVSILKVGCLKGWRRAGFNAVLLCAQKGLVIDFMLCCYCSEIRNYFWIGGLAFLFVTGPCKLRDWVRVKKLIIDLIKIRGGKYFAAFIFIEILCWLWNSCLLFLLLWLGGSWVNGQYQRWLSCENGDVTLAELLPHL